MNYNQPINDLVEEIKLDKSILQPWRNKAIARLQEAQAFVWMGSKVSNTPVDEGYNVVDECTCPIGATDINCSIHGVK